MKRSTKFLRSFMSRSQQFQKPITRGVEQNRRDKSHAEADPQNADEAESEKGVAVQKGASHILADDRDDQNVVEKGGEAESVSRSKCSPRKESVDGLAIASVARDDHPANGDGPSRSVGARRLQTWGDLMGVTTKEQCTMG